MTKALRKLALAILGLGLSLTVIEANPGRSNAAVIFGNSGLSGGYRWDTTPRIINGNERSLNGGLRYSLQGGSYEAFRDLFNWVIIPSVSDFQAAVETAFHAWTLVDPVTGLGTDLSFVPDLGTSVVGTGFGGVNTNGAEIDLLVSTDASSWNVGDPGLRAEAYFQAQLGDVTLTSGTTGYSGGGAISGADITFNNNSQALYSLDWFQLILTHEIGHALGLGDVDFNPGRFIDDNYDGSNSATALATLTNSWADLVNPFNPAASPLSLFNVPNANPGVDTFGVNILMESALPSSLLGDPIPLKNDDFGGRQFLYPFVRVTSVPEPSDVFGLLVFGVLGAGTIMRSKKRKAKFVKNLENFS
ncbi:hypothetical protein ACE1CI_34340 [Aerosakkonemataceae cyanobacterium BLCC-F50]|uniref:PEP-CTERM protein-sorting domain-containing protein n=1 Tax=Floridaenema flaviceps BLCC-F50 TaxID=3153642 RepID=A0ABV4Y3I5_9CYAN